MTAASVGYTIGQSRLFGMFPGSLAENSAWIVRFSVWSVVLLGAIHWRLGRLIRSQTKNPEDPPGLVPATLIFALLVCFGHTILFYDRQYGLEGMAWGLLWIQAFLFVPNLVIFYTGFWLGTREWMR
jgi:hypothetical protein